MAENSIDAVSNRDFVLDYLAAAATCATHLSRLGAEIVLWSSEEFAFCEVSDAWASGSSIMPQKKNPDAAELLRAKAPRLVANLVALHGVMHGLPLTYNKDMQEDKERLFDSCDTLELCLEAAGGMLAPISFRRERLAEAASGTSCSLRLTSPTCWCAGGCRSARLTEWSRAWSAGRSRAGHATVGPGARRSSQRSPSCSTTSSTELLENGAWLETKVSRGRNQLEPRVREQLHQARAALR